MKSITKQIDKTFTSKHVATGRASPPSFGQVHFNLFGLSLVFFWMLVHLAVRRAYRRLWWASSTGKLPPLGDFLASIEPMPSAGFHINRGHRNVVILEEFRAKRNRAPDETSQEILRAIYGESYRTFISWKRSFPQDMADDAWTIHRARAPACFEDFCGELIASELFHQLRVSYPIHQFTGD